MNRIPLRATDAPTEAPQAPGLRPRTSLPTTSFTRSHHACCPPAPAAPPAPPAPPVPPAPADDPQCPGLRPQPSPRPVATPSPFVPQPPGLRPPAALAEPVEPAHTRCHRPCCQQPVPEPTRRPSLRSPVRQRRQSGFVRPSLGPRVETEEPVVEVLEVDQTRGLRPRRDTSE